MKNITSQYLASQGFNNTFQGRFWSKIRKTKTCWIWTGNKCGSGYGTITKATRSVPISAHRASWILNVGPIPKGMCVLHNCPGGDRRDCVNPNHLWIGTQSENINDSVIKGTIPIGERHYWHKLTNNDVREIRNKYIPYSVTMRQLADEFHVSISSIQGVLERRYWKHI